MFREPRVPGSRIPRTRIRGRVPGSKVLGTLGSGFLSGSGTSRFREGSGHTWLSRRFREPYHGFELPEPGLCQGSGITGTPILRHPANPEFGNQDSGKVPETLGSDKVPRTTQMRTHSLDILP